MRISPVRSPLAQRGYGLWHSLQFVVGDLEVVDEGVASAVIVLFNIGARLLVREYFGPENHPFTVIANSIFYGLGRSHEIQQDQCEGIDSCRTMRCGKCMD